MIRFYTFNGGEIPYAQACFENKQAYIFFTGVIPVKPGSHATITSQKADIPPVKCEINRVEDATSTLYEIGFSLRNKGKYQISVTTEDNVEYAMPLTVLPEMTSVPNNPFTEKTDKYSKVSSVYMDYLFYFLPDEGSLLEAGSSTGHFSMEMARRGYDDISLIDVRSEPIQQAKKAFSQENLKGNFFVGNFLEHDNTYDYIWNTGLICSGFPDDIKEDFIAHAASLAPKLFVICGDNLRPYRDIHDPDERCRRGNIARGGNPNKPVGVGDAITYPGINVPLIFSKYYSRVLTGMISPREGFPGGERFWTYGERIL